jgi:hypothetical protein
MGITMKYHQHLILAALAGAIVAALSACAVPTPATAGPEPGPRPVSRLSQQPDPPAPLLEHPGQPPATGHVWIAGRWDLIEGRYRWQAGHWSAAKLGHLWLPHVWRRDGERWVQEGGRWEPDRNSPVRLRRS